MSKKSLDETPIGLGEYRYLTPNEVANTDPGYIVWMYETVKPRKCSKALRDACEQDLIEDEGWMNPLCDQD